MSMSFEDYQQDYNATLSRIRTYLTGARNRSSLMECQNLLESAKASATAMKALAEVDGNAMRIRESQMLLERDVTPLRREVERALQQLQNAAPANTSTYQAPTDPMADQESGTMMESLIQNSEDLLRDSQTVLAETEYIGNQTLMQMGQQREQLQASQRNLERIQEVAEQARLILVRFQRRACRSRLGLYVTIAVLTGANLFVIYCIYRKHHDEANNADTDGNDDDQPGYLRF